MAEYKIDVKEVARNRWAAILVGLGVPMKFLTSKNGPCPICGGKDRYRWTDHNGEGRYYCSGCGPGDGFDLAKKVTGKSFPDIRDYIIKSAGGMKPVIKQNDEQENHKAQADIWGASKKLQMDGPVDRYLLNRGISIADFKLVNIRQHEGNMIAKVTDVDGAGVNIHRTFLKVQPDGSVVKVEKKVMKGELPKGCSIKTAPAGKVLGIAEGIETALSAWKLFGVPTWSVISSVGMINWIPPEEVETVVVYADNDENYAGQASAYGVANKLVTRYGKKVEIRIPPRKGWDWNDTLLNQLGQS